MEFCSIGHFAFSGSKHFQMRRKSKNIKERRIKIETFIKFITGTILTAIACLLGRWDNALQTLIIFMILDYLTGVLKAIHDKKLSSLIGAKGIIKKVGYLFIVIIANFLDIAIGDIDAIRTMVIYFFVSNEGISIMENWIGMGLPMPKVIGDTLEQMKKKEEIEMNESIDEENLIFEELAGELNDGYQDEEFIQVVGDTEEVYDEKEYDVK